MWLCTLVMEWAPLNHRALSCEPAPVLVRPGPVPPSPFLSAPVNIRRSIDSWRAARPGPQQPSHCLAFAL